MIYHAGYDYHKWVAVVSDYACLPVYLVSVLSLNGLSSYSRCVFVYKLHMGTVQVNHMAELSFVFI